MRNGGHVIVAPLSDGPIGTHHYNRIHGRGEHELESISRYQEDYALDWR